MDPELDDHQVNRIRPGAWERLLGRIASSVIKSAKDQEATPEMLLRRLERIPGTFPLLEMATAIYAEYQEALRYRGECDFDDLVHRAVRVLEWDRDYLDRLRARWPFILEDEAQDSSRLQEELLRMLVGPAGNWIQETRCLTI